MKQKKTSRTKTNASKPRILLLDVETLPGTAYIWSLWDTGVPLDRLISPGRITCAAFSWFGEKGSTFVADWHPGGRSGMLKSLHTVMGEADAIITYNGDKFDLPRLTGEFVEQGLKPLPPLTSIDLYKTVKKLGYQSGKLEFVAPYLKIGAKVKHEGFRLWRLVMDGDPGARKRMEKYNRQDTSLLSGLYTRLRPYITSHPFLHSDTPHACPVCGGSHVIHQGYRRTRAFKVERLQCQECGHWHTGKRKKVT